MDYAAGRSARARQSLHFPDAVLPVCQAGAVADWPLHSLSSLRGLTNSLLGRPGVVCWLLVCESGGPLLLCCLCSPMDLLAPVPWNLGTDTFLASIIT